MPTVETSSDGGGGAPGPAKPTGRPPRSPLRRVARIALQLAAAAVLMLGGGFLWFIGRVPAEEVRLSAKADGIVALTGGASRIADAIELLASGRGTRLLISGANPSTNSAAISRLNPEFARWVRCCVDFDQSLNTLGNAIETRRWAERRGFRSLIVVTSNYHMPRALAELAHQLPDVALVPFPVVTDRLRAEPWWASVAIARLMFTEYVKYVYAKVRMGVHPTAGTRQVGWLPWSAPVRMARIQPASSIVISSRTMTMRAHTGSRSCSSSDPSFSTSCSI